MNIGTKFKYSTFCNATGTSCQFLVIMTEIIAILDIFPAINEFVNLSDSITNEILSGIFLTFCLLIFFCTQGHSEPKFVALPFNLLTNDIQGPVFIKLPICYHSISDPTFSGPNISLDPKKLQRTMTKVIPSDHYF